MPNQVDDVLLHTMSGTELSRVRTELHRRRILTAISPHPVQADSQPAPHRYLGNAFVSTHRQVNVSTSPVRIVPRSCLRDRKSTRLNSSHANISYAVFCLKKKK